MKGVAGGGGPDSLCQSHMFPVPVFMSALFPHWQEIPYVGEGILSDELLWSHNTTYEIS